MADMSLVTLIRAGATIDNQFIPDISVGQAWGRYWTENDLDFAYGARIQCEHNYPAYLPQAASIRSRFIASGFSVR